MSSGGGGGGGGASSSGAWVSIKTVALIALVVQNSALILTMRYSRVMNVPEESEGATPMLRAGLPQTAVEAVVDDIARAAEEGAEPVPLMQLGQRPVEGKVAAEVSLGQFGQSAGAAAGGAEAHLQRHPNGEVVILEGEEEVVIDSADGGSGSGGGSDGQYMTTTAVLCAETLKLFVASYLFYRESNSKADQFVQDLHKECVVEWKSMLKLLVPGLLYTVQNNLQYTAASNLTAATFQVLYQCKILTTALFAVFMLRKHLSKVQWGSLGMLTAGVALVQLANVDANESNTDSVVGFTAVICACCTSGFAGVYFEKVLKGYKVSVWLRNIQMAFFGIVLSAFAVYTRDGAQVASHGFFYGYNSTVWAVVALQAFGGMIVAVVVKYADNVIKGFATSISIICSVVGSAVLFGTALTFQFLLGAAAVMVSVFLYSWNPSRPAATPAMSSSGAAINR